MSADGDNGNGAHPQWAIDQALDLIASLAKCRTHADMMNFVCLALRKAYHKGGMDEIKDQIKREMPH